MTIHPLGGVQSIRVPNRPLIGYGAGAVVLVEQGLYAEVVDARIERRHGSRDQYLYLRPIPTGDVLTGFGEYSRPVMPFPSLSPIAANYMHDPSFEAQTVGQWVASDDSVFMAVTDAHASRGTWSLGLFMAADGQGASSPVDIDLFRPRTTYFAQVDVVAGFTAGDVTVGIGDPDGDHAAATVSLPLGGEFVTVAVRWSPAIEQDPAEHGLWFRGGAANALYVDAVCVGLEPGYFDGSMPGFRWAGAPGSSVTIKDGA